MKKRTQRALSLSFLSLAIIAGFSVALLGCPEEKKAPAGSASASAATTASAAGSAKPAGSGW